MQFILGLFAGTFFGIFILSLCRCMADATLDPRQCEAPSAEAKWPKAKWNEFEAKL